MVVGGRRATTGGVTWWGSMTGHVTELLYMAAEFDAHLDSNLGNPKHLPFRTAADPSRTTTRENTGDKNGRSTIRGKGTPPCVQSVIEAVNAEGTEEERVDRPTTTSTD